MSSSEDDSSFSSSEHERKKKKKIKVRVKRPQAEAKKLEHQIKDMKTDLARLEGLSTIMKSHKGVFTRKEILALAVSLEQRKADLEEKEARLAELVDPLSERIAKLQTQLEIRKSALENAETLFGVLTHHPGLYDAFSAKQKKISEELLELLDQLNNQKDALKKKSSFIF
jgi:chromosome segregation ATPase